MADSTAVCCKSNVYCTKTTTFTDDSHEQCDCDGVRICESNGTTEDVFSTSIGMKLEESHVEGSDNCKREVEVVISAGGTALSYENDLTKTSCIVDSLKPGIGDSDSSLCTSIKLLNCFGDWKIFSKCFVVLNKLDCERYNDNRSRRNTIESVNTVPLFSNLKAEPSWYPIIESVEGNVEVGITFGAENSNVKATSRASASIQQATVDDVLESESMERRTKGEVQKCMLIGWKCLTLYNHHRICIPKSKGCVGPTPRRLTDSEGTASRKHDSHMKLTRNCWHCDKLFASRGSLRNHLLQFVDRSSFTCADCGNKYARIDHLRRHMRTHSGMMNFIMKHVCDQCGKSYTRSDRLKQHVRIYHTADAELFRCEYPNCKKIYNRPDVLALHERIHTGRKPHVCEGCDESFSSLSALITHSRLHVEDRKFKCLRCDETFATISLRHAHMAVHTGMLPFTCVECRKAFSGGRDFRDHMSQHANVLRFSCADCGEKFACRMVLKRHCIAHQKRRSHMPFRCNCGDVFRHLIDLSRHIEMYEKNVKVPGHCLCKKLMLRCIDFIEHKQLSISNQEPLGDLKSTSQVKSSCLLEEQNSFGVNCATVKVEPFDKSSSEPMHCVVVGL